MVGEISARHALSKEVVDGVERTDRRRPHFGYALLRSVAELDEPALQTSLDRLADADLLFVEGAPPQASYRFKHALIQDAAYDSLLKSRRQTLHRRAAELLRDDPDRAGAEPEVIAHHFTQGGLDDLAIEWWGKAGDQALRRSAFQEAIAHLGKAIAMADKEAVESAPTATISDTKPSGRVRLQADYAQAVMYSKGFAADETKAAFERTGDLATQAEFPGGRFPALYGEVVWRLFRGEARASRDIAERFLREAEAQGRVAETTVAHRLIGLACTYCGDLAEARRQLELALDGYVRERDSELIERFGQDTSVAARAYLAIVSWLLGDLHRARQCIQDAIRISDVLGHVPSTIAALGYKVIVESARNGLESVLADAENLLRISQKHGMDFYRAICCIYLSWVRGRLGDAPSGVDELRNSLAAYTGQGNRLALPWFLGFLAELEAKAGNIEPALASISEGLAAAQEGGQHYVDALLHRLRGDVLLKRNPADPAPAEDAYQTAIAIAKQQGARSYELLASLALAKLYQSTGRPADAHTLLAAVLEGFSPTPEMPQIAEAQALLAALAETDEVKAEAERHQRRLQLQTRFGQAMMYSRGYASEESKTAFARARTLAAGVGDASERFDAYYGLFIGSVMRGELSLARETTESFLRDAETEGRMTEAGVARRNVGMARLFQGDFVGAQANLAEALRTYEPARDRDAKFRFTSDTRASAAGLLAQASWALGDVERARVLGEEALARADETAHAPTRAIVYHLISPYQIFRGDYEVVKGLAKIPVEVGREHGMALVLAWGEIYSSWARAWLGDRENGMTGLCEALTAYLGQGNKLLVPLFRGRFAELEAEGSDADVALRRIDEALALTSETGEHWTDALLHRIRGEIVLKRDPANTASAEEAFLAAIAIAQAQKARSFELQAALALAKLYQSTDRPVEAHAVLAPALEGFSPTPEMPEIAEAQAMLATLAETEEVKAAEAQRRRRLHLQTAYGQAMMWGKGFSAEETRVAFSRATELSAKTDSFADRFAAAHFQYTFSFVRGDLGSARELELSFLKEAEDTVGSWKLASPAAASPWPVTRPPISSRRARIASGRSRPATLIVNERRRNASTTPPVL
jgi:predicted ATPase